MKKLLLVVRYFVLSAFVLIAVFPIYWTFSTSFKLESISFAIPPVWIFKPHLQNYFIAFNTYPFFLYFKNSLIIACVTTLISVLVGSMASYSIARFNIGGRGLLVGLLSMRIIPSIVMVIPLFLIFNNLNLIDTRLALVVTYLSVNTPFVILVLKNFFAGIPREIDDAAIVDGCSRFQAFWRVILPLALPGLAATAVFCFVLCWNEFLFAMILTRSNAVTLPVAITGYITDRGILWGQMTAAASMIAVPAIVFSVFAQKWMVEGLTLGAVKG